MSSDRIVGLPSLIEQMVEIIIGSPLDLMPGLPIPKLMYIYGYVLIFY